MECKDRTCSNTPTWKNIYQFFLLIFKINLWIENPNSRYIFLLSDSHKSHSILVEQAKAFYLIHTVENVIKLIYSLH